MAEIPKGLGDLITKDLFDAYGIVDSEYIHRPRTDSESDDRRGILSDLERHSRWATDTTRDKRSCTVLFTRKDGIWKNAQAVISGTTIESEEVIGGVWRMLGSATGIENSENVIVKFTSYRPAKFAYELEKVSESGSGTSRKAVYFAIARGSVASKIKTSIQDVVVGNYIYYGIGTFPEKLFVEEITEAEAIEEPS